MLAVYLRNYGFVYNSSCWSCTIVHEQVFCLSILINTAIVCHGAVVIKLGCYGCSIVVNINSSPPQRKRKFDKEKEIKFHRHRS